MSETHTRSAADGTTLFARSWPATGQRRGSAVVVHGLGEHSGRYEHVGAAIAGIGLDVVAPDLRGFGRSGGKRAFVRTMAAYLEDLDPIVDEAARHQLPVVLLGHSLGGLVALRYAQTRRRPDLLILSAPSIDAVIPGPKRLAARVLRRLAPGFSLPNDITGDQLSRDPRIGEAYFADPLVETKTTAALGGAMLEAMAEAQAAGVTMPALVIHGEDDPLVPVAISAPLEAFPSVTRITFPGFRHESFNEEGGVAAIGAVTGWIEGRLAQTAP